MPLEQVDYIYMLSFKCEKVGILVGHNGFLFCFGGVFIAHDPIFIWQNYFGIKHTMNYFDGGDDDTI